MCCNLANQFQEYRNKSKINDSDSEFELKHDFENAIVTVKFCVMVYNIKKIEKCCHLK
jgi:hypothetical protein